MNNFLALDFESQASFNKLALSSNLELAEKYNFLIELTKNCELNGIHWALSCSALLFFKGIWGDFHDFDIIVAPNHRDEMTKLLVTTLGFTEEPIISDQSIYNSLSFRRFSRGKLEVELISEWGIVGGGNAAYKYCFENNQIDICKVSDELSVPLMPLEAQFALYRMLSWYQPERMVKVRLVYLYLKDRLEHPEVIVDALTQKLPNTIRAEIEELLDDSSM